MISGHLDERQVRLQSDRHAELAELAELAMLICVVDGGAGCRLV